ncbi:hypothetical protein ACTA71_006693 [Dictyostelium dimigraforme]
MTNNNNNNNNCIISIYLQKYILNFLCWEINKLKKDIEIPGGGNIDYILDQSILSLRLVSKEWNNYISINNITNVFTINNKSTIIKKTEIKTLKVNYSSTFDNYFFGFNSFIILPNINYKISDMMNQLSQFKQNLNNSSNNNNNLVEITQTSQQLKETPIGSNHFSKLQSHSHSFIDNSNNSLNDKIIIKNLIIRNTEPKSNIRQMMMFAPTLTIKVETIANLKKYFKKIHFYQFEFHDGDFNINTFKDYVDKLFSIRIRGDKYKYNFQKIASMIEFYKKSLKMIEIDISQTKSISHPVIEILSSVFGDSSLISMIEHIKINGIITFNELKVCLMELPKLNVLSINFCFYKLLFFLNGLPNQNCCNCYSFGSFKQESQYKSQWNQIIELLKSNKTILSLEIGHLCINKTGKFANDPNRKLPINNQFINNFFQIISSITSLEKLTFKNIQLFPIFKNFLENIGWVECNNNSNSDIEISTLFNSNKLFNNNFSKSKFFFESIKKTIK